MADADKANTRDMASVLINWADLLGGHEEQHEYDLILRSIMIDSALEIERLRAERDEARRDWCRLWGHTQGRNVAPTQAARLRAWDCFSRKTR
jgi:hypothetical protein